MRPTQEQAREMMQSLLEDRFGLQVRKETKDGPVYHLVVGKDGSKLKMSADQTPLAPPGAPGGPGAPPAGGPPPPPPPTGAGGPGPNFNPRTATLGNMPRGMMMMGVGMLRATAQTMEVFARQLTPQAGRQVIDKTGLKGLYDIELRFQPAQAPQLPPGVVLPPGANLPEPDPNLPSLFTAVQEQLGLKLEPATAPLESIVVTRIEKPSAN